MGYIPKESSSICYALTYLDTFSNADMASIKSTTFQNHFRNLLGKQQPKMKALTCSCPNEIFVTNLHLILSVFESSVFR